MSVFRGSSCLRLGALSALVCVTACKTSPKGWLTASSSTSATSNSASSTTIGSSSTTVGSSSTTVSTPTPNTDSTDSTDSASGTEACSLIDCKDAGAEIPPCDPWAQDCPEGEKCTVWGDSDGSYWTGTKCVPVDPNPKSTGEACTATGPLTGIDNCDKGEVCGGVDPETLEGKCIEFCQESDEEYTCPTPGYKCTDWVQGIGAFCSKGCNPLGDDCQDDEVCVPSNPGWHCTFDESGDAGADDDPCVFINACDPGLLCVFGTKVADCNEPACCTPYCDLNKPDLCPEKQTCIPYYAMEDPPPEGLENLGYCGIPL